ncbi:aminotransferase class IV [uncultured Clostridium sp.]|uniref:aminotransferase class IV n=1 Tax=uncultured Clostridium sp. TaxID=59620 RepID=UPI0025F7D96E|nr:aminotransferase class IV [uncultured Clostridium sp.]
MEEKVIYEVLRIIDGKPVFLEAHIKRMENSFKLVGEKFPLNYNDICKRISELVRNENKEIGNIKLTYGLNSKEFKVFFINHSYPTDEMYEKGVKTILYFGERTNPNAKIVNDDFRSKVNAEIEKNKAFEAVLVDRNGFITEGSKSNIFMVKGKELITSPVKAVLPGVTRGEIIKLAQKIGIKVREEEFNYKDIDKLDGMFISGTSPKVLPISHVGEIKLNPQNDIINQISQEYNNEIKRYLAK